MPVEVCIPDSDVLLELLLLVVEGDVVAVLEDWAPGLLFLALDLVLGLLDHPDGLLVELDVGGLRHSLVDVIADLDIKRI